MTAPIRVLHVITDLDNGGAERMLTSLVTAGPRERVESAVVSLLDRGTYGDAIERAGVRVHTVGMRRGAPSPRSIRRLHAIVRGERPSVVQGWMYQGNIAALVARRRAAPTARLAWNIRSSAARPADEPLLTRLLEWLSCRVARGVDLVIYNSERARDSHERRGLRGRTTSLLPNGFDVGAFRPDSAAREASRASLGILPQHVAFGCVARLDPLKDHRSLLAAFADVARARPEARLVLAGAGLEQGSERLKGLMPSALDPSAVIALGERRDVERVYAALDVHVLASLSEGFANSIGEAMASGVPCIATAVGAAEWVVGDTGVIVPPGDCPALARAMGALADATVPERRALGVRARERIEREFSIAAVAARYADAYESLVR